MYKTFKLDAFRGLDVLDVSKKPRKVKEREKKRGSSTWNRSTGTTKKNLTVVHSRYVSESKEREITDYSSNWYKVRSIWGPCKRKTHPFFSFIHAVVGVWFVPSAIINNRLASSVVGKLLGSFGHEKTKCHPIDGWLICSKVFWHNVSHYWMVDAIHKMYTRTNFNWAIICLSWIHCPDTFPRFLPLLVFSQIVQRKSPGMFAREDDRAWPRKLYFFLAPSCLFWISSVAIKGKKNEISRHDPFLLFIGRMII